MNHKPTEARGIPDFPALWREMEAAGLIVGTPTPLGEGNVDRAPAFARTAWRARLANGPDAKLTVAADLADYAERATAFGAASGGLSSRLYFHRSFAPGQVVAEEFVAGQSLEELLQVDPARAAQAAPAVKQLLLRLRQLSAPSDETSRENEWIRWLRRLLALPCWDPDGRGFLGETVLPLLKTQLTLRPPAKRWVHGDLIARNILVNHAGEVRLIDPEYAEVTHFPDSELARLCLLTPGISRIVPFLGPEFVEPSATARLQFWLQQIEREVASNRPEYLARWLPSRLAEVRQLTEQLGGSVKECPWSGPARTTPCSAGAAIDFCIEEARWLTDSPEHPLRIAGWCCPLGPREEIIAIEAVVNGRLITTGSLHDRKDVQAHFGGRPNALRTGFVLLLPPIDSTSTLELVAELSTGEHRPFWRCSVGELPGRGPVIRYYDSWAGLLDPDPSAGRTETTGPKFSILLPVHNPAADFLRACLDSVRAQSYPNWELCVVDDASTVNAVGEILREYKIADSRIRVAGRPENGGIARATNDALKSATGEFVVMLDHDDVLRPHALAAMAEGLRADPNLDAVYSDEDKIDAAGRRVTPMFKPAFSPEYLRGVMYVGHALCVRRELANELGGFDPAFDGVQDYEFMLRLMERTSKIGHIPLVLYHWRQSAGSSALIGNVKGDMDAKQLAAVRAHLARIGDPRVAEAIGGHRVRLRAAERSREQGAGAAQSAKGEAPSGANVEAESEARSAKRAGPSAKVELLERLAQAARECAGDVILFTSECASNLTAEIAAELAVLARLADSGCVAPVLLDTNGRVHESGCTVVAGQLVPVMAGFDPTGDGFNGSLQCNREVLAVSADCVAVRRDLVQAHAAAAHSWADFCARIRAAGFYHRVCAAARVTVAAAQGAKGEGQRAKGEEGSREEAGGKEQEETNPLHHKGSETQRKQVEGEKEPAEQGALRQAQGRQASGDRWTVGGGRCTDTGGTSNVERSTSAEGEGVGREQGAGSRTAEREAGRAKREADSGGAEGFDPYYNPHFASNPADYRLARRPPQLSRSEAPFVFRLETTVPAEARLGWLELRGWCFHLEEIPLRVRLTCGTLDWQWAANLSRPDVALAHPSFTDGRCGFAQRLTLPAGTHRMVLEASTEAGERAVLLEQTVHVPAGVLWRRWWSAPPAERLAFQLSASPSHPPVPVRPDRFPTVTRSTTERVRFSIVTPSFQHARFLPQTLSSVLDQPVDLEYVVRDGGSSDGSVQILEAHAKRLSSWASQTDRGQADAIATAFRQTSGGADDVMAWINSDDFYLDGALPYVAEYFARHPEVDVIYGHRVLVDEEAREIGRWFLPPHDDEILRLNDFVPQEALFWRRRIWDKVGGIDSSLKFALDWDLLLRFQAAGAKIVRVPFFLACFRIHALQKTSAQMEAIGQKEIDTLRRRTLGRELSAAELENDPRMIRYLRKSAWIELLWRRFGIRA